MTFGERLRHKRVKKDWSQKKLADKAGLNFVVVSFYETGERLPGVKNIVKLCLALGCKPNDLIDVK